MPALYNRVASAIGVGSSYQSVGSVRGREIRANAEANRRPVSQPAGGLANESQLGRAVEGDAGAGADRGFDQGLILDRAIDRDPIRRDAAFERRVELTGAECVAPESLLAEDPAGGEREVRLDRGQDHDRARRPPRFEFPPITAGIPAELVL